MGAFRYSYNCSSFKRSTPSRPRTLHSYAKATAAHAASADRATFPAHWFFWADHAIWEKRQDAASTLPCDSLTAGDTTAPHPLVSNQKIRIHIRPLRQFEASHERALPF